MLSLFQTPRTVALCASVSVGYWSGLRESSPSRTSCPFGRWVGGYYSLETLACSHTLYGKNTLRFTIYVSKHTVSALFCARFFGLVCPVKTSICWWLLPFWNHRGGSSSALTTTSTLFWRFVGNVFEVIFLNDVVFLFVCTVLRTVFVSMCSTSMNWPWSWICRQSYEEQKLTTYSWPAAK